MRLEITRKTDLAVRALQWLAGREHVAKSADIADAVSSTPSFIAQVMSPLVKAGWVRSDPGPRGGYGLAVDLGTVSVLAVIEAVEGPTNTDECALDGKPCDESNRCVIHDAWVEARELMLAQLDAVAVADAGCGR